MYFDTHCHLDMYKNPEYLLKQSQKNNVFIIGMTIKPSHFQMGLPYIKNYKNFRFALGFHPLHIKNIDEELILFNKFLDKTSYIGEIGLDFSNIGIVSKEIQINCFKKILQNIQNKNKFISIHSRKAENEVLSILNEYNIGRAVFHWYTGTISLLPEIINNGHYFSVNPSMFNSKSGLNIINSIPKERILPETDGPYQKFNNKIISPFDISIVYKSLSRIWGIPNENVELIIHDNFRRIISNI